MAKLSKIYNQKNHLIKIFIVIFLFWFALSGMTSINILFLGLISSLFIAYIINKMDLIDHEVSLHNFNIIRLILYIIWLVKEIIISSIMVCICIILPSKKVSPKIIKIKCSQKSEAAKVLYANSITLTPGTVTIDVSDDVFTVHTLDKSFEESLESMKMDKKVTDTENELINTLRKKHD